MNIKIQDYPGLQEILWDYHLKTIDGKAAFHYYEARLNYLDQNTLLKKEKKLIHNLANKYGHGLLMLAA